MTTKLNRKLSDYGIYIAYSKKIILTNKGLHNIKSEHLQGKNFELETNFDTTLDNYILDVYVLESDSETIKYLDDLENGKIKKSVLTEMLKESLFLNVSHQDGELSSKSTSSSSSNSNISLAGVFFNKNTLNFYNNYNIMFTPTMSKILNDYSLQINDINNNDFNTDEAHLDFCLTGDFVLSLCKPKKVRSLEYIHNRKILDNELFDNHNEFEDVYPQKIKDIIYNPKNHFFVRGVKCCSINIVKEMITKM